MRRLAIIAVAVGAALGVVVATAVPETKPAAKPSLRFAPPRKGDSFYHVVPGTVRIELRRPDPDGGPDWAIREFDSDGETPPGFTSPNSGRKSCAQLGRIVRGRFGWVDASDTFRPAGYDGQSAPNWCQGRAPDAKHPRFAAELTVQGDRLGHLVLWGIGGRLTRRAMLEVGGDSRTPKLSSQGGFVEFADPHVSLRRVKATFSYPDGSRSSHSGIPSVGYTIGSNDPDDNRDKSVDPHARASIEVRTPDPLGGLPYGLGVQRSIRGDWCMTGPGRIVEDRVGPVDFGLGILHDEGTIFPTCRARSSVVVKTGLDLEGAQVSGAYYPGQAPAPSRTLTRSERSVTLISGIVRPDVTAVTIATPRDVRTLTPSPRAHAFLAAYNQVFVDGIAVVTVHFRDGRTQIAGRQKLQAYP